MNAQSGADLMGAGRGRTSKRLMRLLAALFLVNGILLAPWWVRSGGLAAPWLALEALAIVGVFAIMPRRRWSRWVAGAAAVLLAATAVVGLGDAIMRLSLGRPLDLYLDLWLLDSVWDLSIGTFGAGRAVAGAVLLPIAIIGATGLLAVALASVRSDRGEFSLRLAAVAAAALVSVGLTAPRVPFLSFYVDAPTVRLGREQAVAFVAAVNEREEFAEALERFPDSYADQPGLLAKLEGRDVILGFIESYGVTALEDPRYAPVVGPRLDDFERRMEAAGLHVVTGRLVAPSQGGQSWYGHGSVLSGLWLDNQIRYDMMLADGRETLIDDFEHAGYRSVAVMPAITQAWPEGRRFGYDEIYAHERIGYAGPPLNWVTMPDQFTWSFVENTIRARSDRPLFIEMGLISSHAPWTPILPVLDDWDAIGDGRVFERFAGAGERPEVLWLDSDRVREHYALSVEYAVHAMVGYAERYADDQTLLIVLGDHQPAPLVTGEDAPWDVPVHVISGDRALLQPFLDWGFVEGAWPASDPAKETLGVDYFRDWFVRAYSGS